MNGSDFFCVLILQFFTCVSYSLPKKEATKAPLIFILWEDVYLFTSSNCSKLTALPLKTQVYSASMCNFFVLHTCFFCSLSLFSFSPCFVNFEFFNVGVLLKARFCVFHGSILCVQWWWFFHVKFLYSSFLVHNSECLITCWLFKSALDSRWLFPY